MLHLLAHECNVCTLATALQRRLKSEQRNAEAQGSRLSSSRTALCLCLCLCLLAIAVWLQLLWWVGDKGDGQCGITVLFQ